MNLLANGDFSDPRSTPVAGASGNAPFAWSGWYKHLPGKRKVSWDPANDTGFVAPEFKRITAVEPYLNPPRHLNGYGWCWFGSGTILHSGLWQRVAVPVGATLTMGVQAHGWSNTVPGQHRDDPFWSDGVGTFAHDKPVYALWPNISVSGIPEQDAIFNMAFDVGIDPAGGIDPFSLAVTWGQAAHIYNAFAAVREVSAVSLENIVTAFLRVRSMWGFGHNDSYWANAYLVAQTEQPVDYVVVVNLLPQDATMQEKAFVLDRVHDGRETILQSADDAKRLVEPGRPGSKVIVWAPGRWTGGVGGIVKYLSPCALELREF